MEDRMVEVSKLQSFIGKIDTELTMILQHLQWDQKQLIEGKAMVECRYDKSHKVPQVTKDVHEEKCLLIKYGYSEQELMLPNPLDVNTNTCVKFSKSDIQQIIDTAAQSDPTFRRECAALELEPLSLGRLQATYSADERRAVHDAVVGSAPFCHDLSDLALLGDNGEGSASAKQKSRVEILAELRDMKRRRAKYRGSAARSYCDELRALIHTQMEMYADAKLEENEKSCPTTNSREHSTIAEGKHHRSRYPSDNYKSTKESKSNESHGKKQYRDDSRDGYNASGTKRRTRDLVEYPDLRMYKHTDRYNDDASSKRSRSHWAGDDSATDRKKYNETNYRDTRGDHYKSSSSNKNIEIQQEHETHIGERSESRYKDRTRHSSKHRSKFEEMEYRKERDNVSHKDHKRDRKHGERSKESWAYERSRDDRYGKEKQASEKSSRSKKDDKHESRRYYDSYVDKNRYDKY